ncbi:MAG: peroxiredoxin family protein [Aridibacter sp.]
MKTINTAKFNNLLEVFANLTILVIGLLVIGLGAWHLYQYIQNRDVVNTEVQNSGVVNTEMQNAGIKKGKILPQIPNLDFSKSQRSLVIAMSTNCGYCKKSVQFLNSVKAASSKFAKKTQIIAVFPNTKSEVERFNKTYQSQVESVSDVRPPSFNVPGTPTMILVAEKGVILNYWVGAIPEASKSKVLEQLAS